MFKGDKILALIPARAGSKRIKNKNTLLLAGKPLLNWTIDAAKASRYIDKVLVSSDSEEICQIGIEAGADAPFLRPPEFSNDHASSSGVVLHALKFLREKGEVFDTCLLLQPTSPMRTASHIDEAIEQYKETDCDSVISVTKVGHPIEWVSEIGEAGEMDSFFSGDSVFKRSQDYPARYMINGAIYIFDTNSFLENKTYFFKHSSCAYVMGELDSVDIDSDEDVQLARALLENNSE